MYKYSNDYIVPTSMSDVLSIYSQEDIFKIVFNEYPDFNQCYTSPFRIDNNPNCYFEWYKGKLLFKDYGDIRRDCFHAIKDYFNLDSYFDVFEVIFDYYKNNELPTKSEFERIRIKQQDSTFYDIPIRPKEFQNVDFLFWKQYYITKEQLEEDKVVPTSRFRFFSKKRNRWFSVTPFDITYAYCEFEKSKKIYRPYSRNKNNKWITNCKSNDIGNIKNIDKNLSYLMITKSYKDCRVIRNENYTNTVWFQSERLTPSDDILKSLIEPFDTIILFYDNDATGKSGSIDLKNKILLLDSTKKVILIYSPFPYFKDPAEIVSIKGKKVLKNLLWKHYQL